MGLDGGGGGSASELCSPLEKTMAVKEQGRRSVGSLPLKKIANTQSLINQGLSSVAAEDQAHQHASTTALVAPASLTALIDVYAGGN